MKINLYYVHDPMCSWCYAFKETLKELKEILPKNIELIYVVGGLAKHSDEVMPKFQQEMIENIWHEIANKVGTKFNHDFWKNCTPKRSTYLSCKATILARHENKEEQMIEAIQEAYYLKAMNPSEVSTLVEIAKQIEMDEKKFQENLLSEEIEEELNKELEFRRKLYVNAFPSLVLKYKKELYPINIKYNEAALILKQIENLSKNIYF